jgi:hypothetical protein
LKSGYQPIAYFALLYAVDVIAIALNLERAIAKRRVDAQERIPLPALQ